MTAIVRRSLAILAGLTAHYSAYAQPSPSDVGPQEPVWTAVPLAGTAACASGLSYWQCFSDLRPPMRPNEDGRVRLRFTVGADEKVTSCAHDRPPASALIGQRACAYLERLRFRPQPVDPTFQYQFEMDWTVPGDIPPTALARPATEATLIQTGYVRERPDGKPDPCSTLVCASDYPGRALRNEVEGVAVYHVVVNSEGQPNLCWVSLPTPSGDLDEATCRIIMNRARFRPAQDENGAPRVAIYSGRMRWTIAQ